MNWRCLQIRERHVQQQSSNEQLHLTEWEEAKDKARWNGSLGINPKMRNLSILDIRSTACPWRYLKCASHFNIELSQKTVTIRS